MFNIVLLEPEKPDNTGNIGRTCVCAGAILHLIYPIGFILTESKIKHAGLDYWERLEKYSYDNYNDFLIKNNIDLDFMKSHLKDKTVKKMYFATTKAHKLYSDVEFNDGDYIIFGKESKGIPEEILSENEELCIRIPMFEDERSLNLSNSVSIVLYEALRQNNFSNLKKYGDLHKLNYV